MSRSGITTTNPNDGVPTNRSAKTSTSNNTKAITPISFPTGASARRELKRLLQNTKDPKRTITTFQKKHSLHSFLARGFGTVPSHEANSKDVFFKNQQLKYLNAGGEEGYEKKVRSLLSKETNDDAIAPVIEPFEPESALTFVGHFGVSRHEMHSKISDALRSAVEDNISGVDVNDPKSVEVLLKLLASALPYHVVPELRPVSVNLVKRLGEKTPVEVLKLLASKNKVKDDGGGCSSNAGKSTPSSLIYGEVLQGLGPNLRRLVWEADWNSLIRGDGIPLDQTSNPHTSVSSSLLTDPYLGTIRANNILADMVRPVVEEYVTDKELVKYSDLAFVGTVREKYIHTQKRRTASLGMAGSTSTNTTNCTSKILSGNNNTLSLASVISGNKTNTFSNTKGKENSSTLSSSKKNDSSHTQSSGSAVTKLKKIIGLRPNLLAAVLNMLIAEHGSLTSNESILGGSKYLHCTLVADILISYGNLPRQYEHLGILANILDKCVKIGIVSDQAIAQIQGCLKTIFQPSHEKEKISNVDGTPSPSLNKIMETPKDKATSLMERAATISISTSKSSTKKKINVLRPKVNKDKPFELKLLSKIIKEAIAAMKEIDVQSTFLKPVTDQIAPGYSTVISKPICISDMEKKCINQEYFSLNQYSDDVKLMFQNCITYNTGKDGKWFRSETNRQKKCWNDEIFEQAKDLYKKEMAKRKKVLEKAAALDMSSLKTPNNPSPAITMTTSKDQNNSKSNNRTDLERKRKHDSLLAHQAKLAGKTMSDSKGNNRNNKIGSISNNNNLNKDEGLAIENLTAKNISPLQPSKAKKRKKDFNFPSMPTLVSMLLSDPFVSRLLIDKIYRTVKKDVLGSRIVPSEHFVIPSILQILHVAQFSTQLCAFKGKKFFILDPGLQWPKEGVDSVCPDLTFPPLRKFLPLFAGLMVQIEIDRRVRTEDDVLHNAISGPIPNTDNKFWEKDDNHLTQQWVFRALVECAIVNLFLPGNSFTEMAISVQLPRLTEALENITGGDISEERPFFISLINALLRHKSKLSHIVRDLIINVWLNWFKVPRGPRKSMFCAVHECFIRLLNELASISNKVLPRDKLMALSYDAVSVSEASLQDKSESFAKLWRVNEKSFFPIKKEYEKMLKSLPNNKANEWQERVGISEKSQEEKS